MIFSTPLNARLVVDTVAKTAKIVWSVPATDGEGDVDLFTQALTLTTADKRRLRHLLDRQSDGG